MSTNRMDLFNVPVGTAVGVYTFWVLLQEETTALLEWGGSGRPRRVEQPA